MADLLMTFILHVIKEDSVKGGNMQKTVVGAKQLIPSDLRIGQTCFTQFAIVGNSGEDKYVSKAEDDTLHISSFIDSKTYSCDIIIYNKATASRNNNIGSLTVEDGT
eukprot:3089981-Ditylum_brightwellii.AAC.1